MGKETVNIEAFQKLDLRVGTIKSVENVEGADKLYKIQVDLGEKGVKQTIAGIARQYTPNELINKKIIFVANLEPAVIRGEKSEGMMLAALKENEISILTVDRDISSGAEVS